MVKGYKKIKEKYIEDIDSNVIIYEHIKSKARICTILNDDPNKVFSIAFRTPPINSCGLTHILEHSVLCGSKKYPVKDPFVELMKSSLYTFLNAYTFPDKTVYPVASLNLKDFHNLMDIYLNSVFYPNIYQKKEIFLQEGWHYEIDDINSDITYNGVVYNEMKGAFSDSEEILQRNIMESLFPDTSYGLESGGDPKYIPDLSYEEFLNFHKKYYHPSNSYIYLYGNLNMDEELEFIDKEYLSKFDIDDFDTKIKIQKPFEIPLYKTEYYQSDEEDNNTYLSYNVVLPADLDNKQIRAIVILIAAILRTPGAPLKDALVKANLAGSIDSSFDDGLLQPVLSIYAVDSNPEKETEFINIINNKLHELANGGLNKYQLEALIRFNEFKAREQLFSGGFPKGLEINLSLLAKWLYDEDNPFDKLEEIKYYKELLKDLEGNYFEDIINKYLINNNHKSFVKLIGTKDFKEKEDLRIKEKLRLYKESLSEEELLNLINENKLLKEYQSKDSTKEELDTLPKLNINEIEINPIEPKLEIINEDYKVLFSDYKVNGISYVYYYFDISKLNYEDIMYLSLYTRLFIHLDTNRFTRSKLNELIQAYTGGISIAINQYQDKAGNVKINLIYSYSATKENVIFASTLINEMIYQRKYDKEIIKTRIKEISIALHNGLVSVADSVAIGRALSYIDETSKIKEEAAGLDFAYFIDSLLNDFDNKYDYIVEKLKGVTKLLAKTNFMLAVTSSKEDYEELKGLYHEFYDKLNDDTSYETYEFTNDIKNEGLIAPFDVNFTAYAATYDKSKFNGAYLLASNIINTAYLWPEVRVLGGAYGAGMSISDKGRITMYSYRDPNVKKTYDVFDKLEDYVNNLTLTNDELNDYKIGTLGSLQLVLHPKNLAAYGINKYLAGKTIDDEKKLLNDIIVSSIDYVKSIANIIKEAKNESVKCAIGMDKNIKEDKKIFKEIRKVFK